MGEKSPVVNSGLLRAELKRLREDRGLTQREAADSLNWSISKLIRIESRVSELRYVELDALLNLYGVTSEEERKRLYTINRACRQSPWWLKYEYFTPNLANAAPDEAYATAFKSADSSGIGQNSKLKNSILKLSAERDRWSYLADRGFQDTSGTDKKFIATVSDFGFALTFKATSPFVAGIVGWFDCILASVHSALANVTLARTAVIIYSLISALLVAAFMSHRHSREPADKTSLLMAKYRPLAGGAAA